MNNWRVVLVSMVVIVSLAQGSVTRQEDSHYFAETGVTLSGQFLTYWQKNGGLAQFGYPLSEAVSEKSEVNGHTYITQYFERAILELHPENRQPYDVLLSLLGSAQYQEKYHQAAPNQSASVNNPYFFPETVKTIGGVFRNYWEQHGGLSQFGYPISNEFQETSDLNGKSYKVQYFERTVFEYHPENAGTPYEVLLSQLGTARYLALLAKTNLSALYMISSAEGWAVADSGIILHYHNGHWVLDAETNTYLNSISMDSADDGWAGGNGLLHYTSGRWHLDSNANYSVSSIKMVSANEGWAVAYGYSRNLLHYTNGKWVELSLPALSVPVAGLVGSIDMLSAEEGWLVDLYGFFHYQNGAWQSYQSIGVYNGDTDAVLHNLKMFSANEGWAVGIQGAVKGHSSAIYHYNGDKWVSMINPGKVRLYDVDVASEGDVWAVGGGPPEGGDSIILHYSGSMWTEYPSPTTRYLTGVKMVSENEGWAVGWQGTILHYQNGIWSQYRF